jgi:hypothetical protein
MARGYHEYHGLSKSPEYLVWGTMISRCTNPKVEKYPQYGGRGIKVCDRWLSFLNFISDLGHRPSAKHSLERKDNNGDYCPSNCRWATRKEQGRNRRTNHIIEAGGLKATLVEWSEVTGISEANLKNRINNLGWDSFRALTTPVKTYAKIK